jgi:N-methylhydantoinase A/oxoprolinase/acetone carboxylase beta subunit
VAGDKITHYHPPQSAGVVQELLERLKSEMENNEEIRGRVESLQRFYERHSEDGVDGLEKKLLCAGRAHETHSALEKKELFAKLLDRWSLYASAQEIFACLLAKAEHEFSLSVRPKIGSAAEEAINHAITTRIVEPIIQECGTSVFVLNHGTAMGMVYWLAEQCFVRWHK